MNIYGMNIPLLAIATLAAILPVAREHGVNEQFEQHVVKSAAVAPMQEATAQLKVIPSSGAFSWPNNGVMPILTYGWGGDRPLPPIMAIDSSIIPQLGSPRPPILIVQRRHDIFSSLLRNLLDQEQTMRAMTIVVAPVTGESMSYTMWNARVIGIRDVGKVIEENPVTEEIVIVFERLTLGSFDEGGR
jgi:hypothetical protein